MLRLKLQHELQKKSEVKEKMETAIMTIAENNPETTEQILTIIEKLSNIENLLQYILAIGLVFAIWCVFKIILKFLGMFF